MLVVGAGYAGQMQVSDSLRSALEKQDIRLIAESTHEAVETFNRLQSEGKKVAGAFHLACQHEASKPLYSEWQLRKNHLTAT